MQICEYDPCLKLSENEAHLLAMAIENYFDETVEVTVRPWTGSKLGYWFILVEYTADPYQKDSHPSELDFSLFISGWMARKEITPESNEDTDPMLISFTNLFKEKHTKGAKHEKSEKKELRRDVRRLPQCRERVSFQSIRTYSR